MGSLTDDTPNGTSNSTKGATDNSSRMTLLYELGGLFEIHSAE